MAAQAGIQFSKVYNWIPACAGMTMVFGPGRLGLIQMGEGPRRWRAVAADTVQDWPPRAWCPDDPY